MPQGLLIVPLLGGFLFLHLSHVFRFRTQRYDGYRILFASAVAGLVLLILGRAAVLLFSAVPVVNGLAGRAWFAFSPFPHSDSCAWSLALAPLLAAATNRLIGLEEAKDMQIAQRRQADALTRLLHTAARDARLLSLTLDSRKWYVGYVAEAPNLNPEEKYFRLLPLLSGYRDKDTLETYRTVFYEDLLETEEAENFVITLPLADVKTANFFDPDVYEGYFSEGTGAVS
jgi:hypothetical protein